MPIVNKVNKRRDNVNRERACTLYKAGKSVGEIGLELGKHKTLIFKWVRDAGILDPERRRSKQMHRAVMNDIPRHQLWAFEEDKKSEKKWAKITSWDQCPKIKKEAALARYYANHEENKKVGREKAKAFYNKMVSIKEWKESRLKKHREFKARNPDKARKYQRDYLSKAKRTKPHLVREWRRRARHNIKTKITNNLRRRMKAVIKGKIGMRSSMLIGCNHAFIIKWLERQFLKGMTWANYGIKWQIDHIIPCAAFNLHDREQAKKCFHYSNLRPLWSEENQSKSDTIIPTQPELCMPI